jgi:hypothetical protein
MRTIAIGKPIKYKPIRFVILPAICAPTALRIPEIAAFKKKSFNKTASHFNDAFTHFNPPREHQKDA